MSKYCEDCGCKVYSGRCSNCHEASFIYHEQYMNPDYLGNGQQLTPPDENSDFMRKVREQDASLRR
ncbi:hypothetical protein [Chania multitudinisentens]|uniref:hypothetical protein n=1 Tax=Chania multitudinisentens TaxID=1639108 RepID=UPI0012DD3317|nr:hypothetical protein [Chania multitudinisentens]